ncbi:MAG: aminodeoxychorismate/anthranilate synthase component II [Chloroflexi bacterium]|jgi:para-aminobenzoate synthetase component II|nr:aminodeoxychorismate/anthranilate synthase component II [Chloroflexota bacterium]
MILVIDNYDSFTYNLVQMIGELGEELVVYRNDKITVDKVAELAPSKIVISPGPGRPEDGRISNDIIREFYQRVPILGVCLGNQCIAYSFGGKVVRAGRLMHGKTSMVNHDGNGVFRGLSNPFEATRYHSLIAEKPVPEEFIISAWTDEGEIMGLRHKEYPLEGVQFHPESILTLEGSKLLHNFIERNNKQ